MQKLQLSEEKPEQRNLKNRKDDCLKLLLSMFVFLALSFPVSANTYWADVTAYTHTGNRMANGEYPHVGAIACDDLPIGTRVLINGREYVVKDRFGGGHRNKVDIFVDTYEEAINFGRKRLEVVVLG